MRRKILLWLACGALTLLTLYCLLAIVQAGSIYKTERAQFNLRFRGALGLASLLAGVACARFALCLPALPASGHQSSD